VFIKKSFELKDLILRWNKEYPFDYVWRKKYNVAFNSPQHREMNFIDIKFDILEEQLIIESIEIVKKQKENKENYMITGKWLNNKPLTSISDEEFFNIKV